MMKSMKKAIKAAFKEINGLSDEEFRKELERHAETAMGRAMNQELNYGQQPLPIVLEVGSMHPDGSVYIGSMDTSTGSYVTYAQFFDVKVAQHVCDVFNKTKRVAD